MTAWAPSLGAWLAEGGVRFRVWAPETREVLVVIEGGELHRLEPDGRGYHTGHVPGLGAGGRYRYRLDGEGPFPDPASRHQPEGVHGPSEVIDPAYPWTDEGWGALDPDATVLYEMHIGAFTPEGTFAAAAERLEHLARLGVDAVQVMPVADFPGDHNWGYDGVALFAPSRANGRPEDLRAFVDRAHALGIGVVLDVVYNHFGPDGAYHSRFSPAYFTERHHTPWGAAINLDAPHSAEVRSFFIESALHWMHEYHVDGFRLDAVHTLIDESPTHFLAEYRERLDEQRPAGRPPPLLIAEEHRNLSMVVRPRSEGGYGFDVSYADDFHHEMHVLLAGNLEGGYLADYRGSTTDLVRILRDGWLYTGQFSAYHGISRGEPTTGVPLPRFLHALQNHDQVGNRAFGDRLFHETSAASYRAATALLLFEAATPALFMGDEWGASTPFLYFTDHHEELGRLVREGRRNEFRDWSLFRDPVLRKRIPDPQALATFERSRLSWDEPEREPYASTLRLHQALLALRHTEPALGWGEGARQRAAETDSFGVAVRRERPGAPPLLLVARLRGAGPTGEGALVLMEPPEGTSWQPVLTTEAPEFVLDPLPVEVDTVGGALWLHFRRPGATIFRAEPEP